MRRYAPIEGDKERVVRDKQASGTVFTFVLLRKGDEAVGVVQQIARCRVSPASPFQGAAMCQKEGFDAFQMPCGHGGPECACNL